MRTKPIVARSGGLPTRLHLGVICMTGSVLRGVRYRSWQDLMETGGFYRALAFLDRYLARPGSRVVLELTGAGRFEVELTDPYWSRIVLDPIEYEPELADVLDRLRDEPVLFLDCGANRGYWSVRMSAVAARWRVVAVEASPTTYDALARNAALNDGRFECLNGAVAAQGGRRVAIVTPAGRSVGAHVSEERRQPTGSGETIEHATTVTIDELAAGHDPGRELPVVVKLDVEGMEVPALRGAGEVLRRDPLILYEDHGHDDSCEVSAYILDALGYEVFHRHGPGRLSRMRRVEDVRRVKVRRRRGYNFFASRPGSDFHARLCEMCD
jgi:FkbM family methyltransferase